VKLNGLEANTKYYYRVKSADIDGNEAVMDPPNVFTTLVSVPTGSRIGDRAPDFTLPVFKSQDNVSLRSFKGQKVLLTFWAVYCPECDRELALLQSLKNRNLPGVTILAVFLESRLDDIDKTIAKYKADRGDLSVPVLVDMYRTTAHMYNVDRVPCTIFIDGDGIIREIEYGSFNIDQVEQTLDNL
jgi:peroxiredoxin